MPKDKRYMVTWAIDIWATTSKKAAEMALRIQRDHESTATVFDVIELNNKDLPVRRDQIDLRSNNGKEKD